MGSQHPPPPRWGKGDVSRTLLAAQGLGKGKTADGWLMEITVVQEGVSSVYRELRKLRDRDSSGASSPETYGLCFLSPSVTASGWKGVTCWPR